MTTRIKAAICRYLNARNARILYLTLAIVALILGAGAPDCIGGTGGGGGG